MRTAVCICVKDRPTELALLLESLRTQTYQDFDIFIFDDMSGTPLSNYHFLNMLIVRLQLESHKVFIHRAEFQHGVSKARQAIIDKVFESFIYYDDVLRVDDDVILEPDFIERLKKVLDSGYDIASGVTPPLIPTLKRDPKFVDIANRIILDKEGNWIFNGDDCGIQYLGEKIVPAHHFRSSALMKRQVHEKVKYTPTKLSKHGFREEEIFSLKALMEGFKIGVDLNAIAWHLMTPSGGERFSDSNQLIPFNQQILDEFVKENKDKLTPLFPLEPSLSKEELTKQNNLIKVGG